MIHTHEHRQLLEALTWCAESSDATTQLRQTCNTRLRVLTSALNLHHNVISGNGDELVQLKQQQHEALQTLATDPTRDNLREVSDLVASLDNTKQRQLRDVRAAERAVNEAHGAAGRVFVEHTDELVQLVALERARDLTACGDDAVPAIVRAVWRRLHFTWHPHWDELLMLPHQFRAQPFTATSRHLPLTWADTSRADFRAAVAWVWQSLAAGDFERVNVPLTLADRRQGMAPGSRGTCLRITSNPSDLPRVPPAKQPALSSRR